MNNKRKVEIGDIILWQEQYGIVVALSGPKSNWLQVRFLDKPEQEWLFSQKEASTSFEVIST